MNSQMGRNPACQIKNVEKTLKRLENISLEWQITTLPPPNTQAMILKGLVKRNPLGEIHKEDYIP